MAVVAVAWTTVVWGQPAATGTASAPRAFAFFDQNPVVQIYGLPRAGGYTVLALDEQRLTLHVSQSSHFVDEEKAGESLLFDGATTRAALVYARGVTDSLMAWLILPLVSHSGGFADGFVEDWHDFFGLPGGGREHAPDGRQIFGYARNGQVRFRVDEEPSGLGDIRLGIKKRLAGFGDWGMSVAAQLKLPTGDADKLTGSGGTDLAVWGVIGNNQRQHSAWRFLAAAGALYTSDGEVLPALRQNVVGFGWLVLGYALTPTVTARAQLNLHTPFYTDTRIEALDGVAVQGALGVDWQVTRHSGLSFAVIEDLNPGVTPDVGVLLSFGHDF